MSLTSFRRPVILDNVTLVAVTGVAIEPTIEALQASLREAEFAAVLLLSPRRPRKADPRIAWREIEPIESRSAYSHFMLRSLWQHISTDYALCVQWDGFVVNGEAWDQCFLDYDYIGAVWPHFDDQHIVGNGGFSLRSRRLLDACLQLPLHAGDAEDVVISRLERKRLESQGIRFAPPEIARRFSYERGSSTGREFGFHGAFNLVSYLSPRRARRLFLALEPELLSSGEHRELMRWALSRGHIKLAITLLLRLWRRHPPRFSPIGNRDRAIIANFQR